MARTTGGGWLQAQAADDRHQAAHALRTLAHPLSSAHDLDPLMARIGNARCVLLGEATHGTHEFYAWRARITQRLMAEKGFSFMAVEGDWPDCEHVNRYVKGAANGGTDAGSVLRGFERWPTWMWANQEMVELVEWLHRHNQTVNKDRRIGFYGLDVYSLWDSMEEVVRYLQRVDPKAAQAARRAYECFAPYSENELHYAHNTALVPDGCEEEVARILAGLRARATQYQDGSQDAYFSAEQNALITRNAAHYYRTMLHGGPASWNIRDRHMAETLQRLLEFHGPHSKAVVWEHNTHIGDARFTSMIDHGEANLGQMVREAYGERDTVLVGFSTYEGSVIAAEEWDAPAQVMRVPPARTGSHDQNLHHMGLASALLVFAGQELSHLLLEPRGHRAIGVVYHPAYEHFGNYVPTVLPKRYDALIHVDQTRAVQPLHVPTVNSTQPELTYPSGM